MSELNGLDALSPANVYTIQQTLPGHTEPITVLAWSPDGQHLASSSLDGTIRLWDGKTGALLHLRSGLTTPIWNMIWSPDGQRLASSSLSGTIHLWDGKTAALLQILRDHTNLAWTLAWSPDGQYLASGSLDRTVCIWDTQTGSLLYTLPDHTEPVMTVAWSPDGQYLASGSLDYTICLWNPQTGNLIQRFSSYADPVKSLSWFLNGHVLTSISLKNIVGRWDVGKGEEQAPFTLNVKSTAFGWSRDGQIVATDAPSHAIALLDLEKGYTDILEGQTGPAKLFSFSSDGQFLASFTLSDPQQSEGAIYVWRRNANTWILESTIRNIPSEACIAFHPDMDAIALSDKVTHAITILRRDEAAYSIDNILADTVHYKNAKVVLVGDSGVGKTGLAFVLTGKPYEKTDSTHGRHIWTLYEDRFYHNDQGIEEIREILLWDLAGQPGYRLIHQLYLDRVTIALVVFDARSETHPFTGIDYWERALRQAHNAQRTYVTIPPLKKFLVEARIDRGGVGVSTGRIETLMQKYSFDAHFKTSAKENIQIEALRTAIEEAIVWEELPGVSSTRLIQTIKDFLVEQKKDGRLLDTIDALYQTFVAKSAFAKKADLYTHFEKCIDRLESAGLIKRLSFGNLILLQPEILDAYASALINAVREEPEGFGSITEERVRKGDFFMSKEERLVNKELENLLLIALIEDLLRRELILREEPFLVFPAQSTREYPDLPESGQKTVVFTFDGPVLNSYVTLAVRLANSGMFKRNGLWKNAVTYIASVGGECGILLHMDDEGHGELSLFFDEAANEQTRFLFEEYVYSHLENKVLRETLKRRRNFFCDQCGTPIAEDAVQGRLTRGHDWINCNVCDEPAPRISLLDKKKRIGIAPSSLIQALDNTADRQRDQEAIKSSLEGKRASNSFDVFLWCSYADKPVVKKYGRQLMEQGILPWFDEWEIQPGLSRRSEIERYLKQAKSAAVFFGKGGTKTWLRLLEPAFVQKFAECGLPLIPVILPDAPEMTLPDLPSTFQGMQWVDFHLQDPEPFKQLIFGITGKRQDL